MAAQQQQQGKLAATIACFMAHLNTFLLQRSPEYYSEFGYHRIGCVWTGEFELNTLRVDGNILNPERKSCGFYT